MDIHCCSMKRKVGYCSVICTSHMKLKCADFQFLLINMVIIIGSPKPIIVSRASETHCGPAKIDFGWPDWPAREKIKHDP